MRSKLYNRVRKSCDRLPWAGRSLGWSPLLLLAIMSGGSISSAAGTSDREKLSPGGVSPLPNLTSVQVATQRVTLNWSGLGGPFQIQSWSGLSSEPWVTVGGATLHQNADLSTQGPHQFYRILAPVPRFAGAAVCAQCHRAVHAIWSQTGHAKALDTLKAAHQETNPTCLVCHTVGFGQPTGFKDEATTPQFAGVQCENCHGPAENHAISPFDIKPVVRLDSEMCGGCHSGFHHATYDEWRLSKHAQATPVLQSNAFAQQDCLQCHSQDFRYAPDVGAAVPTVAHARYSVECSTCHAAHGGVAQANLLRKPVIDLCGECHTQGEVPLGQSPHHPQAEMLKGIGAFGLEGTTITNVGPHAVLLEMGACAHCHVVKHTVEQPNAGNPNVTGHTFNPFDESIKEHQASQYASCVQCHVSERSADRARTNLQKEIDTRLAALAPYFTTKNPAFIQSTNLSAVDQRRLQAARFNYEYVLADGSRGVHNPLNAREALSISETVVNSLKP